MTRTYLLMLLALALNISTAGQATRKADTPQKPCNMKNYQMPLWRDGFVVLSSGDTISGRIMQESFYDAFNLLGYKYYMSFVSPQTCKKRYNATEIRCFQYLPSDDPWELNVKKEPMHILWSTRYGFTFKQHQPYEYYISVPNDFDPDNKEKSVFLQELRMGERCSIYGYERAAVEYNIMGGALTAGLSSPRSEYVGVLKKYLGNKAIVEKKKFTENISRYFGDCPALAAKIKNGTYTYDNWPEMVIYYNDSCRFDVLPGVH